MPESSASWDSGEELALFAMNAYDQTVGFAEPAVDNTSTSGSNFSDGAESTRAAAGQLESSLSCTL